MTAPVDNRQRILAMSALQTSRDILLGLSGHLSDLDDQIACKVSSEALHDYRVVVRKTRTLLAQLDDVLPEPELSEFRLAFSDVMARTSYLRDLEGCCSDFARYINRLGNDLKSAMEPLLIFITKQEKIERRKVQRYLVSSAYKKIKSDWYIYLHLTLTEHKYDLHTLKRACLPVQTVAKEAVRTSYLKTVSLVAGCDKNMSYARFHKLRKSYKKLRYLLEIFSEIFPSSECKQFVRELKTLQGKLGTLQDTEVQLDILKKSVAQIEDILDKSSKKAIGKMIRHIKDKRKKARIDASVCVKAFTKFSANKFDLLLY